MGQSTEQQRKEWEREERRNQEVKSEIYMALEEWFYEVDFGFISEKLIENDVVDEFEAESRQFEDLVSHCISNFFSEN